MLSLALFRFGSCDRPKFSKSYHLSGTWSIPYWQMRMPFVVDTKDGYAQSDISYDHLQHEIHFLKDRAYSIQTSPDGLHCSFSMSDHEEDSFVEYLPDLTDEAAWEDYGEHSVLGKKVHGYIKKTENNYKYIFYVDATTNMPVRYHQFGQSIRHSHPAEYILDIVEYSPFPNETNFMVPVMKCLNRSDSGPRLNKFAGDISMQRKRPIQKDYQCKPLTPSSDIKIDGIKEFSWRNYKGVVQVVRDQANCGSCWAQSAGEAISSQISLHSKGNFTVSIQQIMDCVWNEGHTGSDGSYACAGGEGYDAYGKLAELQLNLTTEEEYPYLGVSGHCQKNFGKTIGKVTGCYQIMRDSSNKDINVLRALYKYGPLMIYIRAGTAPFVAYTGGSFNNHEVCGGIDDHDKTDHGVLLTGWKTIDGVIHYEIMNSWSTFWGEEGFAYISSENDCGVPVMPLLPLVEINYDL